MTPSNPRLRLQNTLVVLVWLLASWPLLLLVTGSASPVLAVSLCLQVEMWLKTGALLLAVLLVVLLLYPPVPAGLRLALHQLLIALRSNKAPLRRAQQELASLDTPARHLEVARLAMLQGDVKLATPHLEAVLRHEPEHTAARHQLALALFQQKHLPEAEAQLRQIVQQDPGHAFGDALLLLGWCRHLRGDDQEAAELLRLHQRQHGGNRRSHYWLAQVLLATGDQQGAAAALAFAASPPTNLKLTAEENWYRARARVQRWRVRGAS